RGATHQQDAAPLTDTKRAGAAAIRPGSSRTLPGRFARLEMACELVELGAAGGFDTPRPLTESDPTRERFSREQSYRGQPVSGATRRTGNRARWRVPGLVSPLGRVDDRAVRHVRGGVAAGVRAGGVRDGLPRMHRRPCRAGA